MPELPEVETTRRGIATVMPGRVLRALIVHEPRLRWPVPAALPDQVCNQRVLACDRRGKYLLIRFEPGTIILHLGMSGSLRRVTSDAPLRKHDHIEFLFDDARFLLHDPRRFGAMLWHPSNAGPLMAHPLLAHLGMEPFDPAFTPEALHAGIHSHHQAIKQVLLGGHIVVGVGNIYASESLFQAQIDPRTRADRLSRPRCARLHAAIRTTLTQALESGGSTLRDYVNAQGTPGAYFTLHAAVYERDGQPCPRCATPIRRVVQGQRATYFCPHCQTR
ncbi:MAG: bifunctional DNA-formamidopyrimidine glycosylase/DNA-(apurinic or apyrimidinic site) lyase [Castellaniella sp.]|uniref:bifunctional DNA-formamidopyrimidine glycosylase/DNA-(apurinic or apyrimidinic site) lyase n=1 Tax=Castellaniella sp. TaxID=1955812 RepID=UPI00120B3CC2|nr:bifunctional DNA-formamidopyrimidine glycosylase/DNA-(apurinic or apyrimidinic site) lyase [Castellaniella sp.]TAN28940.1 MAG: bifunctional DNA-formamidopyrimidine glycosylase/DNA-(apurinic or apyrimidinic site) lyase [Castellaniella sp.]